MISEKFTTKIHARKQEQTFKLSVENYECKATVALCAKDIENLIKELKELLHENSEY